MALSDLHLLLTSKMVRKNFKPYGSCQSRIGLSVLIMLMNEIVFTIINTFSEFISRKTQIKVDNDASAIHLRVAVEISDLVECEKSEYVFQLMRNSRNIALL